MNAQQMKLDTAKAFDDPQVGDHFTEMLAYHVFVVARGPACVTIQEASAPCKFPDDAKQTHCPIHEFQDRFAYKSIPGYSVMLIERGVNVDGWDKS